MAHADVLVCDCYQKQEAGPSFSKYERLKWCRSTRKIPASRSTE